MTRALTAVDRVVTLAVGLGLIALGAGALDWRYGISSYGYEDTLDTSAAIGVIEMSWWPWTLAAAGVVIGLVGVWWLLAHFRTRSDNTLRLSTSGQQGRVEVDLRSVAQAASRRLEATAPVNGVAGSARRYGRHQVVELRGYVDARADGASLTEAVRQCTNDVARAFPEGAVSCRVVLSAPRSRRFARSSTTARVH